MHQREHRVISTSERQTDLRGMVEGMPTFRLQLKQLCQGTKRKHHQDHGLMGEDGAIDRSKRPRQVSSIGPFKYPLPRSQGNAAYGRAAKVHRPSISTAGVAVPGPTTRSALSSTDVLISSQLEGGVGASALSWDTGTYSPSNGNAWTLKGNNPGPAISNSWDFYVPGGPSLDQPSKSMVVPTDTEDVSVGQAMTPNRTGQGPHSVENAAAHVPTLNSLSPDETYTNDPHPTSVVTNNAQSWDPTRMLDSLQEPIGSPSSGLSAGPHPHHWADRDNRCAQESAQSPVRPVTGQSHYQPHPIVSGQRKNHNPSPTVLNGTYPASTEVFGVPSPDYSDVSSANRQDLNNAAVSSNPTTPQPPSPAVPSVISVVPPVREDSLDTLIRSLTVPAGTEPLTLSSASSLPEDSSSTMNRNCVTHHLSSSHSSPLPNGNQAENEAITAGAGSDDEFDEYKSMGVLKLIMERAASKKSKERRGRFKKTRPGAAPSVELNTQPVAPPPPTSLQQMPQSWASPSPSIIVSRPESDPSEWYGHLVFDVSLEALEALGPIPVAISLSSPYFRYCSHLYKLFHT